MCCLERSSYCSNVYLLEAEALSCSQWSAHSALSSLNRSIQPRQQPTRASKCCWPVTASRISSSTAPISPNDINYNQSPIQMRREYTLTSPQPLYPHRPSPASFNSPSHQEDPLDHKYPNSSKYNPLQQQNRSPPQRHIYLSPNHNNYAPPQQSFSPETSQAIEISQLRLTVNQLRASLQNTSQNSQRLQEELAQQRSKNLQLIQVRRRMEEELARMQFQLDRIANYDALQSRQATVKLQNAQRDNQRLSQQLADALQEVKNLKNDQRALMTQCDTLLKDKQILMRENEELLLQLEELRAIQRQMRHVKQEVAMHSQESLRLHSDQNIPSRINNLHTVRTYQASTINHSPRPLPTHPSLHIHQEESNEREELEDELQKEMEQLQEENKSLKQLYHNFYSAEEQQPQSVNMQTFSNKVIAQQLHSSRLEHAVDPKLKTLQKEQLAQQMAVVRQAAIGELIKAFSKVVEKAEAQRSNSFKVFMHHLLKNAHTYTQMAQNYLQVRTTIQEETGLTLPHALQQPIDERQRKIMQIYQSVKEKSKSRKEEEKESAIALAVFRLLTLLVKASPLGKDLSDNIKHSVLKYVYKLGEKQRLHSQH